MVLPVRVAAVVVMAAVVSKSLRLTWHVIALIPVTTYEVDWLSAGLVAATVLVPVFGMTRGYVQIDGGASPWSALDDHRLPIDHWRWWEGAKVDTTIEARLADADRYANFGRKRGGGARREKRCQGERESAVCQFHSRPLIVSILT